MHKKLTVAILLAVLWMTACGTDQPPTSEPTGDTTALDPTSLRADPAPTDTALERPGDLGDGAIVMVNGRAISPAGAMREVLNFPVNLLTLPSGDLVVASIRTRGFEIIDGDTFEQLAVQPLAGSFQGLATNAAGDRLWVSGGAEQKIYEYDITGGAPVLLRELESRLIPSGVAVTPDESKLLVCNSYGSGVQIFNLTTGLVTDVAPSNSYPYEIAVSPDGAEAYVSNWGDDTITIINVNQAQRIADVAVGTHPEGLALSPDGDLLYVANADSDTVSVVDVATQEELAAYDIYRADEIVAGSPLDVAVSADGATLYVAAAGLNAVVVLDAVDGEVLGMIPAGYYPTAVALDDAQGVLYVANGKGGGIPDTAGWGVSMDGTLQKIGLPTPTELAAYTQQATDNLTRTALFWETMSFDSPIPTERGTPSTQIKRVVFIMKENKTYDQVFGDRPGTEADPGLVVFGADRTPNAHNLADTFSSCDNYYSEANVSLQGHLWSVAMYSNDYTEKAWASNTYREPLTQIEPAATGGKGSIFRHLYDHGVTFRAYGQVLTIGDLPDLAPYVDFKYGFWNQEISDETKAAEVIRELEAGIWPQLLYISLPNDHTYGGDPGKPTADYLVGDNDAGLGLLVDYISHSPYWNETAIFVIQDDPQSGADHVDPHRSPALVISPWAKKDYNSSVLYSMSSVWMTIEMILGLPPMTVYDEHTSPMYDCFTLTSDNAPYTAVANPTPLEFNPEDGPMAALSHEQNWLAPDQVRRLGEIIWRIKKPGVPWPAHLSVDSYAVDEDDEEEGEAEDYVAAVQAMEAFAQTHGLWDGSRLPTIRELVAAGVLVPAH